VRCLKPLVDQPAVVERGRGPVERAQRATVAPDDMTSLLTVERINGEEHRIELERAICAFLTRFANLEENN